ncbi:PREDICTED: peptide methionine sulfoxide reductase A2-like [Camelina sativa]|uniref:peptide-methionine (S)-S-oxide reductase n=1 Tax=Camelina sativa TaxID=90675 RepID=A0ABM0TA88_CAMSA|nr:PREDICTED: peptide methionine sulfoxide reductase A2-like [Camelina sativa]
MDSSLKAQEPQVVETPDEVALKEFYMKHHLAETPVIVPSPIAEEPDNDVPAPGNEFAEFAAGCFWGFELALQRIHGVTVTEVGYTQGISDNPSYEIVCTNATNHVEVVRVQYDPKECTYETLLDLFWSRHDPTTLNRQGELVGAQYRSGVYYYTPEQEKIARESLEKQQTKLENKIVTEILPAKKLYKAEEYHQQYLAKGGMHGNAQSPAKSCKDPIRCYG